MLAVLMAGATLVSGCVETMPLRVYVANDRSKEIAGTVEADFTPGYASDRRIQILLPFSVPVREFVEIGHMQISPRDHGPMLVNVTLDDGTIGHQRWTDFAGDMIAIDVGEGILISKGTS